jgi:membrane fusion protein, heavy metal efflux system
MIEAAREAPTLAGRRPRAQATPALPAAVLILALALPACTGGGGHAPGSEASAPGADTVVLKPSQLGAIRIAPLEDHTFAYHKEAVGLIDFDQNLNVQVFTPYPGRIIDTYADLGDHVEKGQPLFSIESPDFIAAESNLIGAAASFDQTTSALKRARELYARKGIDQNDYEAAVASQQTADGALKAARRALAIFGRSESDIDAIIARRRVERALIVRSPLTGRVTARNAAPGLLEQPGNPPAPFAVASLRTKWMVANVTESDSPLLRLGQPIEAAVAVYPGRSFSGTIDHLGRSLDPNTHRLEVRCDLKDPDDELIPGMLATFAIRVRPPFSSLAIPVNGVVRNGDGSFAAWVTTDRQHFTQRIVRVGEALDGEYPVLSGLKRGELAVTDGAVFVSNILYALPTD